MAAIMLPAIGTAYGPCVEACQHRDCALTRAELALSCVYCQSALGSGRPVYTKVPAHAACLETSAAKAGR